MTKVREKKLDVLLSINFPLDIRPFFPPFAFTFLKTDLLRYKLPTT